MYLHDTDFEIDGGDRMHVAAGSEEVGAHQETSAGDVFSRMRESQAFVADCELETEVLEEKGEPPVAEQMLAEDFARGKPKDGSTLSATVEVLGPDQSLNDHALNDVKWFMPRDDLNTLSKAIAKQETLDGAMDNLVRLLCFLRLSPAGCDSDIIERPLHTSRMIVDRKQKWHDLLRHQIAQADLLEGMPAQRKSRLSAWIEQNEKARKQVSVDLPSSLKIDSGDVVAVRERGWHVALILSIWRVYKTGNRDAQLVVQEIERGGMHSARVVFLQVDAENPRLFTADHSTKTMVVPAEAIGLRLDGGTTSRKAGIDAVKILLPEDLGPGCWMLDGFQAWMLDVFFWSWICHFKNFDIWILYFGVGHES